MEKEKKTHTESDVDFRGLNPFTHISAKCHSMFKHTTKQVTATTKKLLPNCYQTHSKVQTKQGGHPLLMNVPNFAVLN